MAAERRSLAEAIEQIGGADPEAARAFITQERPKEPKPSPVAPVRVVAEPTPAQAEGPAEEAREEGGGKSVSPAAAKRQAKPGAAKRPESARLLATLLVPVTVRLRPEIASALKRASLERQLNGVETYTQQDIVEEALLPWLRAEGLLD
jgi:hypothetical protein